MLAQLHNSISSKSTECPLKSNFIVRLFAYDPLRTTPVLSHLIPQAITARTSPDVGRGRYDRNTTAKFVLVVLNLNATEKVWRKLSEPSRTNAFLIVARLVVYLDIVNSQHEN